MLKDMEKKKEILFFLREVGLDLPGGSRHCVDYQVFTHEHVIFIEAKGRDLAMGKLKRKQSEEIYNIEIHVANKPIEIMNIIEKHK